MSTAPDKATVAHMRHKATAYTTLQNKQLNSVFNTFSEILLKHGRHFCARRQTSSSLRPPREYGEDPSRRSCKTKARYAELSRRPSASNNVVHVDGVEGNPCKRKMRHRSTVTDFVYRPRHCICKSEAGPSYFVSRTLWCVYLCMPAFLS